jgi:hypothetical protein
MTMVFKLVTAASRTWRRLSGKNQLPKVVYGAPRKMSRSGRMPVESPV